MGDIYFDVTDSEAVHIEDIEVISSYRHHGYGAKMLKLVEYVAHEFGINKIDGIFAPQDEKRAKLFYEKNGFRVIKRDGIECVVKNVDLNNLSKFEVIILDQNLSTEMEL